MIKSNVRWWASLFSRWLRTQSKNHLFEQCLNNSSSSSYYFYAKAMNACRFLFGIFFQWPKNTCQTFHVSDRFTDNFNLTPPFSNEQKRICMLFHIPLWSLFFLVRHPAKCSGMRIFCYWLLFNIIEKSNTLVMLNLKPFFILSKFFLIKTTIEKQLRTFDVATFNFFFSVVAIKLKLCCKSIWVWSEWNRWRCHKWNVKWLTWKAFCSQLFPSMLNHILTNWQLFADK